MPAELAEFCERCSSLLAGDPDAQSAIDSVGPELEDLLRQRTLFATLLSDTAAGGTLLDLRRSTMFDNEILLHADPSRRFSLRLYLYEPGDFTPVHDHNSWGVIGPVSGELEVTNYLRKDDGSLPGHARLVPRGTSRLAPGETESTLPLNAGIHKVGNPTHETLLSVSLYGPPIQREHINGFDLAEQRVYPIYAPKTKKRRLAAQALEAFRGV
jgi:predicted metal-dependent enzyme (double-stranded beta helix superfamily)